MSVLERERAKEQDTRGRGRTFPDKVLFAISLRNEFGRPCFPFSFLLLSSLLRAEDELKLQPHTEKSYPPR